MDMLLQEDLKILNQISSYLIEKEFEKASKN